MALRFSTDEELGIRRTGRQRFRYTDQQTGRPVTEPLTLERIRGLAVPPAWTDVWICADAGGHLQATGRDARGRKQYRYHPDFRARREAAKFEMLAPFGAALGGLRRQVDTDLSMPGMPRERVVALVVRLLEATLIRVGNEEYAATNGTFGLTTLRRRHVRTVEGQVELKFPGKGGKLHRVACEDKRLCRLVRRCQELGGQLLFEYVDEDGTLSPVTSSDVNDYLRQTTDLAVTAKTFRTWAATLFAASALATIEPPRQAKARARIEKLVIERVAAELGNTPAVCRASYIHPMVLDGFASGALQRRWASGPSRAGGGLVAEERKLLRVLDNGGRRRTPRAA